MYLFLPKRRRYLRLFRIGPDQNFLPNSICFLLWIRTTVYLYCYHLVHSVWYWDRVFSGCRSPFRGPGHSPGLAGEKPPLARIKVQSIKIFCYYKKQLEEMFKKWKRWTKFRNKLLFFYFFIMTFLKYKHDYRCTVCFPIFAVMYIRRRRKTFGWRWFLSTWATGRTNRWATSWAGHASIFKLRDDDNATT